MIVCVIETLVNSESLGARIAKPVPFVGADKLSLLSSFTDPCVVSCFPKPHPVSKSVIIFHIPRLSAILVSRFLLDLQAELLLKLKDGAVARDVYNHAVAYIKERKPELESHFVKNIGFAVSH